MDGLVEDGCVVLGGPLADEHRVVPAVEAVAAGAVAPGAVEELDLQVAGLFELPEERFASPPRRA
jgi:hypothetical protein